MAARTHAQQLANHTLLKQVFSDPLYVTRAIAEGQAEPVLTELWQRAASEIAPILRMPGDRMSARIETQGIYSVVFVSPPPPRQSGDPAAIVIIGRGDGRSKLNSIGYYVLTVNLHPTTGMPSYTLSSRDAKSEKPIVTVAGPLPDPIWLAEHALALYGGAAPEVRDRSAEIAHLPGWYWWYTFEGAEAMRTFTDASEDPKRFDAIRRQPILLLPEITDAVETYLDPKLANKMRELRPYLRRDPTMGPAWKALAERLANTTGAAPGTHATKALSVIAEAREHGALTLPQAYELEAFVRCKLALLGIDAVENDRIAQKLALMAAEAAAPAARDSAPELVTDDPLWTKIFVDDTDVPNASFAIGDEAAASADATFQHYGGIRCNHVVWTTDEQSAMAHLYDSRWVFRTAFGAKSWLQEPATMVMLAEGLAPVPPPQIGDDALAFGGNAPDGRRTQIIVVRVGRVVARLRANEGVDAAASRQILHAAVLHPLAQRATQRCREGIGAYWLWVAKPTNAVPALLHSPGHDVARLIDKYPLLAHGELPAALGTLGDKYAAAARSLASYQAQLRAHRWETYRRAMIALVKALIETDMGDTRVNAAFALEIVYELGHIQPDAELQRLAATCEARL